MSQSKSIKWERHELKGLGYNLKAYITATCEVIPTRKRSAKKRKKAKPKRRTSLTPEQQRYMDQLLAKLKLSA